MRYGVLGLLCLVTACDVADAQADPPVDPGGLTRLRSDQPLPAELAGTWQRLSDGARLSVDVLEPVIPGAYLSPQGQLVLLRDGDDAGAEALSMVGLPAYPVLPLDELAALGERYEAFTPESLPIALWRRLDGFPWPWVLGGDMHQGLAALVRRVNPGPAGFAFDPQQGCYVDGAGRAVGIGMAALPPANLLERSLEEGPFTIALGDVIAHAHPTEELGRIAVLVRDAGRPGLLDPADEVVSASAPRGGRIERVRRYRLGDLLGPVPVHCFRRDPVKGERRVASRYKPDHIIWRLPRHRQLMILAGLILGIVVLYRWGRLQKRRRCGR